MTDQNRPGAGRLRPAAVPGVRRLSGRLDRAVRWRVEEAVAPLRERLDRQERRIAALEHRLDERLPDAVRKATRAFTEVERMQPQTASMEQRLEELRQRLDTRLDPGSAEDQAEARRLLDEVRREHQQIRSRMTAIAWYEDRLRKLEEAAAPVTGDGQR